MIEIHEPGPPLSRADLALFEQMLETHLPNEYSSFLMKSNGGLPTPDLVEVPGAPGTPTDVQVFFGIKRQVESSDLLWNKETFSDRLPERLLPIACDSGGNLFCLSLAGTDRGYVIYVDLDQEVPAMYPLPGGFESFLAQLFCG